MLEERFGLYYPYVHFRSDEWVKKALLVFPRLVRMVADDQKLIDSPFVASLARSDQRDPLVRLADLHSGNVLGAQWALRALISEDLERNRERFLSTFGKTATLQSGLPGFQMNLGKTSPKFAEFLHAEGLAWTPSHPDQKTYSELHPRLGRALLGGIAVACAEDGGYQIVAPAEDEPCRVLNLCLASGEVPGPYRTLVREERILDAGQKPGAETLLEFIVHCRCDVTKLDAEGLRHLHQEREPLRNLKEELQKIASIPRMKSATELRGRLEDETAVVLRRWQQDRANLSNFGKALVPLDKASTGVADAMKETLKALGPAGVSGALSGAIVGQSIWGCVLGVIPGVVIGVIAHAVATGAKVSQTARKSPFRYLTQAEENGVVFSISS